MTKQITALQAMQHPTVVATINVLSETTQRLQDEIDELKALAQPEQEPAVWLTGCPSCGMDSCDCEAGTWNPPPQRPWVELTDAEIQECYSAAYKVVQGRRLEVVFARAVGVKLKEKNT